MLSVAEIMTREPYTLGPDNSLADAARLMREHHIRHVPVVNADGAVVGLVSHRDVLASGGTRRPEGPAGSTTDDAPSVALSSVMSSPVQTVEEHEALRATAVLLHRQKIGCMPVTRDNDLVGIVSASDFLEVAMTLMEQLEEVEPEEAL